MVAGLYAATGMARGLSVTLTHTGAVNTTLLLSDVYPTTDGHTAYRRAGAVYVPVGGVVELTYSDTVALSLESGSIRGFVDLGYLTAVLSFGTSVVFPPSSGDVSGVYPNLTVVGIQSNPVDPAAPAAGETLAWDGAKWTPTPAGGDVSGAYPSLAVVGLNGVPIDLNAPANGDALLYNALANQWQHAPIVFGGGPPVGPAGGDLGGLYPNPTVVGLQGNPVSNAAPTTGAALVWDGAQWAPSTGGLTGSYTMVSVVAAHNAAPWEVVLADTSAGGFTVTLPLAASCPGKPITVKKVSGDGNVLVVDAQGAELVDGSPGLNITGQYVSPTLVSDGANWWIT